MSPEPLPLPVDGSVPRGPLWRRALPFVITAILLGAVLARIDFPAFFRCLASISPLRYLGAVTLFILALLTADTFGTTAVYRRSVAPVRFREIWLLRGASYLPSILNHHVGQAFLTYFLARRYEVPLARVAGATLLVYFSWMAWIAVLGVSALALNDQPIAWMIAFVVAAIAYLAIIAQKPARLAATRLFGPLFEAGVGGHLAALAARLPHVIVAFLGTWGSFLAFGIDIPIRAALAYVPLIMVAVSLPITPQGFGTRDMLAVVFFERFAPGARRRSARGARGGDDDLGRGHHRRRAARPARAALGLSAARRGAACVTRSIVRAIRRRLAGRLQGSP
ncbi:MAG: lysylphosphatidylglycerol synthase domain-containing protein [Byssovorax sp.]